MGTFLIPFLCQEKIYDAAVLDPIPAHVKRIQRYNIFRIIVPDAVVYPKFTLDGLLRCQQIRNLHIQLFTLFIANEIDLLIPNPAYGNVIAPAQQLQTDDISKISWISRILPPKTASRIP